MDDMHEKKPDSPIACVKGKYTSFENGEFWVITPECSYRAGSMMNPTDGDFFEVAIDNFEEEMRILQAQARAEFGF